ncbi:hypothetical protein ACTQ4E_12560 [Lawsonibacter sp. LCP25S3_G6]|uniref:hypothetical protein n=1 Tax=unclassified Lawsonibacter TaxID=2617946 RepID=UPI003F94F71B
MSQVSIDGGRLDQRMEVLELKRIGDRWSWQPIRRTRANVTMSTRSNLFSSVGIGARGAGIILRRQELTLHNALRWGDQHLFLTSILPEGRLHWNVSAALVEIAQCQADMDEGGGAKFPGVLTEKYMKFQQENPYSTNTITYVLVTPKAVTLQRGGVVSVNGTDYAVQLAHVLDPYKNEYEICRTEDL